MFRIAIGGFSHETHTFLEKRTTVDDFADRHVQYGPEIIERNRTVSNYIRGFIEVIEETGGELVGTVNAAANVHGYVTRNAFEKFTTEMTDALREAEGVDGVLLALHGAMAAEDYDRAEAEAVRRVRSVVGADVPIMVTLDLHANEDHHLTDVADAVFVCKKYPHTDTRETGEAAARCMVATLRGEFMPAMALHKPGIISPSIFQGTDFSPMRDFRERADEWERVEDDVCYVSVAPGFGYADVPDVGASVIAVTNGDKALAEKVARDMSAYMWKKREELARRPIAGPEEAVQKARSAVQDGRCPVVLADGADRTGDSTHLLRQLMRQGAGNFVLSSLHDPSAVQFCQQLGEGSEVAVSAGGWGQASGEPIHLEGRIEFVGDVTYELTGPMNTGGTVGCGPSATLNLGDSRYVVLTSLNHQVRDAEGFRAFGVDPSDMDILIVRSRVHFRAYYDRVAGEIIEVDAPGMGPADLSGLHFYKIPADIFPVGKNWQVEV